MSNLSDFVIENGVLVRYNGTNSEVTIPNEVTSIGSYAFYDCENLASIDICDSVTTIESSAFYDCQGLKSITVPNSVTSIGDRAFRRCSGLVSVALGNQIAKIGNEAFSECKSLKSIVIPNSVTSVGSNILSGCTSLTSIVMPDSLKDWKPDSFEFVNICNLKYIENNSGIAILKHQLDSTAVLSGFMPNEDLSAQSIVGKLMLVICYISSQNRYSKEEQAIYSTYIKQQSRRILQRLIERNSLDQAVSLINTGLVPFSVIKKAIDNSSSTEITAALLQAENSNYNIAVEEEKAMESTIRKMERGESLTQTLKKLWKTEKTADGKNLAIVEYIGEETEIVIPEKIGRSAVTEIREIYQDLYDNNLRKITIPSSISEIRSYAFSLCLQLENIVVDESNGHFTSIYGVLFNKDLTKLICHPSQKANAFYVIPQGVAHIADCAFHDCSTLTSITMPEGVISIGDCAFWECIGLTSIYIPYGVVSIGRGAFWGCTNLKNIDIPNSVTSIRYEAFCGCSNLESITVPPSVSKIDWTAFDGCKKLTIYGYSNSQAQIFAKKKRIKFVQLY